VVLDHLEGELASQIFAAVKKAHAQVVKAQEKLADRRAREERDLAAE
jgi:hypothetical protein